MKPMLYLLILPMTAMAQTNPAWKTGDTYYGLDAMSMLTGDDTSTAYNNTAFGEEALAGATGSYNTGLGFNAGMTNGSGSYNTAVGGLTLRGPLAGSTQTGNTALGYGALYSLAIGNYNLALGHMAGSNLTGGQNNIDLANRGVAGDTAVIRIGVKGTHKATFIAGISGVTITSGVPVVVNAAGQLGVAPVVKTPTIQAIAAQGYTLTEADVRRIVREELAKGAKNGR